ncbi:hypothetical protein [Dyadobacter frigoris]|uniref:hypothetical protein n=1 Tax=Dyadobacter frigoris TaxID=2576211 RepID=UPI001484F216|nr:hypothetical protein [Dyadobacter frigoris]GLU52079.1 hypothetical protein Dfri01_15400 [Dyadobacter frigoris]
MLKEITLYYFYLLKISHLTVVIVCPKSLKSDLFLEFQIGKKEDFNEIFEMKNVVLIK